MERCLLRLDRIPVRLRTADTPCECGKTATRYHLTTTLKGAAQTFTKCVYCERFTCRKPQRSKRVHGNTPHVDDPDLQAMLDQYAGMYQ